MPRIIVDTDVFSYIFNKHERSKEYAPFLYGAEVCLSFASIGELFYGAYHNHWGEARIAALKKEIRNYILIPGNYDISVLYGEVRYRSLHNPIEDPDYWIAACALYHDCHLATNNRKHFKDLIPASRLICP